MSVAALVLAAGRGARLGASVPKAFVPLCGRPLLLHALEALAASPAIDWLVPVVAEADFDRARAFEAQLSAIRGVQPPVAGGDERQDSVAAGLAALTADVDLVAVHDAARPFVGAAAVGAVVEAARAGGAALLAVPARDTIKRVRGARVVETPDRAECWAAQTPQVFRVELLREALAKAAAEGFVGTDDAQLVERLGVAVTVVQGEASNVKITDARDLEAAERWLRAASGGAR